MKVLFRFASSCFIAAALIVSSYGHAASLAAFCMVDLDDPNAKVQGTNTDQLLPIASTSKVMTTWWTVLTKGLDYRFLTTFHVTPVGPDLFDVHIEGTRDPLFGLESMQFAMDQLNDAGIHHVRNLTYDEGFKFFRQVTGTKVADTTFSLEAPLPTDVQKQLMNAEIVPPAKLKDEKPAAYNARVAKLTAAAVASEKKNGLLTEDFAKNAVLMHAAGIEIKGMPSINPAHVSYLAKSDFKKPAGTISLTMKSAPMQELIKEMNRNSNNHAANQIFESNGGAAEFSKFIQDKLKLDKTKVDFVNGPGTPLDPGHVYNQASCEAMLVVLKDLRSVLIDQKHNLMDVMAVVGIDSTSTAGRIYKNDTTDKSVIAKTGTVNPAITLAGLMSTKKGNYLFMYNMSTVGTDADWSSARGKIKVLITKQIRDLGGGTAISYSSPKFSSVDSDSEFVNENAPTPATQTSATDVESVTVTP